MRIVSFKICPFVQRVTATLEAKSVDYEVEYISLRNKPEWFLEASPNGQVPILITDKKQVIFESDAIVEYIEEAFPKPLFRDNLVEKAQERAWSYLATKHYLTQCGAQRSREKDTLIQKSEKLSKAFGKLEKRLSGSKFFNGNSLGAVDIAWLTLLHRAAIIERYSGYDFVSKFPKVKSLQSNILATGIAEKSVSIDFVDRFSAFYLSKETYLGQCAKAKSGQACCGDPECIDDDFNCCS